MRVFSIFFLLCFGFTQSANADVVTASVSGFVDACSSPCVYNPTGQLSITFDTSVSGTPGSQPDSRSYANAVTEITIGSLHIVSPMSTLSLTNDFYNNVGFVDLLTVNFTFGDLTGMMFFLGFDYTSPSEFLLTSGNLPSSLDTAKISNFFGYASLSSDNSLVEFIRQDNPAPSVPEPSTWAMLLIGFAGLSFAAYRRKPVGANVAVALLMARRLRLSRFPQI